MQRSRVAGNGSPGNLKDRIAALQQRAASTTPSPTSTPAPINIPTSSSSGLLSSPSASSNTGNALRDRIAKFEKKGGVPVPRGSFGLGAPPPQQLPTREGDASRKKGELYGNRIASVQRQITGDSENSGSSSPPTSIRRQYTGGTALGLGRPRNSTDEANADIPLRKRCISTSGLEKPETSVSTARPADITNTTAFEDGTGGSGTAFSTVRLFTTDDNNGEAQPLVAPRFGRSVSASPAIGSSAPEESSIAVTPPTPDLGQINSGATLQKAMEPEPESKDDTEKSQSDDQIAIDHSKPVSDLAKEILNENAAEDSAKVNSAVKVEAPEDNVATPGEVEEDPAKTPVVSAFPASSTVPPVQGTEVSLKGTTTSPVVKLQDVTTENESVCSDPSSISTPTSSPLHASLEISERVYHEAQKFVVVQPSGSSDTTIANVLEQHEAATKSAKASLEAVSSSSVLGQNEGRASTDTINGSDVRSTSGTEKAPPIPPATISIPSRRRDPPSPLSLSPDKQDQDSEPPLSLKTAPKSFSAVIHGKTQASFPSTTVSIQLPRAVPPSQVVILRERAKEETHAEPSTPGSPELSSLVAQAMFLEQQLEEDTVIAASSVAPTKKTTIDTSSSKPEPPKVITEPVSAVNDDVRGAPSRQGSGWSSENASSVDSAPVLTPPSPTFDLGSAFDTRDLGLNLGLESPDDSRRSMSMSSVLSSPGRSSVRKKVINMSRNSIRRLGRRSSSTLALPGKYYFLYLAIQQSHR